jgi:hypothetical protein
MDLASCNTFGAKFFTDGCVEGPMYDERAAVLCCPGCSAYHWLDELTVIRDLDESEYFAGLESDRLPIAWRLQGESYDDAIRQRAWTTPEQEKYLRIRAWWHGNDRYRHGENGDFALSVEQTSNLLRLLDILQTDDRIDPASWIFRAEMLRELGRFDESLAILERDFEERFQPAVGVIRRLAKEGKRAVAEIV